MAEAEDDEALPFDGQAFQPSKPTPVGQTNSEEEVFLAELVESVQVVLVWTQTGMETVQGQSVIVSVVAEVTV